MRTKVHGRYIKPFRQIEEPSEGDILSFIDLDGQLDTNRSSTTEIDSRFEEALDKWTSQPIDPTRQFPIRVLLLRKDRAESWIVFNFAHSSVDGIRAFRFMREVLTAYNGEPPAAAQLPQSFTRKKGNELFQIAQSHRAVIEGFYRKMITSLFHRIFIAPLNPPTRIFHDRTDRSPGTGHCLGVINPEELEHLRSAAKTCSVKVNDVLVAAGFRVIEKWNSLHGRSSRKITIMVPIDIGSEEYMDVISNQVSYVSLPTLPRDRDNPAKLLLKVRGDMDSILKNGISFSMIYFMHFACFLPLLLHKPTLKLIMLTKVLLDTILLTNVGIIWPELWGENRIGNAKIVDLNIFMPCVSPMGMSLGIYTYDNRLHIALGYRNDFFSKEKARQFLDLYIEEITHYQIEPGGS